MDTLDFVQQTFNNEVAEVIRQYTATTYSDTSTFNTLVHVAASNGCATGEDFASVCFPGEKEVLDYLESQGERCTYRRKDGTIDTRKGNEGYKLSKVGMGKSTYSSAKAVISNALDCGISLYDKDNNPKGKTALEKEINNIKKSRDNNAVSDSDDEKELHNNKSDFEKACIVIDTLAKIVAKLEDSEQIAIAQMLSDKGLV